jgi:hypothetical protein
MSRLIVALLLASAIVTGDSGMVLAQTPEATPPSAATPSPPPAPMTRAARAQLRAEKRELRVAALANCRTQGRQQSLGGGALKDFVKICMTQAPR